MLGLLTNTEYHFVLKPVHVNGASDSLKDMKISTEMGRYKNTSTPYSGKRSQPLELLYKPGAIVLGLLYAYIPLMILPIYSSLVRIDPAMKEAAINLGATPAQALRQVTLPLALPGVLIGAIFVFVPSFG